MVKKKLNPLLQLLLIHVVLLIGILTHTLTRVQVSRNKSKIVKYIWKVFPGGKTPISILNNCFFNLYYDSNMCYSYFLKEFFSVAQCLCVWDAASAGQCLNLAKILFPLPN